MNERRREGRGRKRSDTDIKWVGETDKEVDGRKPERRRAGGDKIAGRRRRGDTAIMLIKDSGMQFTEGKIFTERRLQGGRCPRKTVTNRMRIPAGEQQQQGCTAHRPAIDCCSGGRYAQGPKRHHRPAHQRGHRPVAPRRRDRRPRSPANHRRMGVQRGIMGDARQSDHEIKAAGKRRDEQLSCTELPQTARERPLKVPFLRM